MIVPVGAQRIPSSRSHYSVDGTAIVSGAGELSLETGNAGLMTIVAVVAVPVGPAAIIALALAIPIVTRSIPIIPGTVSVTVRIAVAIGVAIAVAVRITEERKAAYENETGVTAVAMIPIAAVPIAAVPIAAVE